VLVVLDKANIAVNGGVFNQRRAITLKGYVKQPDHEAVRVEAHYRLEDSIPVVGYASLGMGWSFTVVSVVSGILGVPYLPLISYVLGEQLRGNYGQVKSNAQQTAIDEVSSGAVTSFLNAAWAKIDEPAVSEKDAAVIEAKRVAQERVEEEHHAEEKLAQVKEEAERRAEDVTVAEGKAEEAKALAKEEAAEEKAADDENQRGKAVRKKAREAKAAKKAAVSADKD